MYANKGKYVIRFCEHLSAIKVLKMELFTLNILISTNLAYKASGFTSYFLWGPRRVRKRNLEYLVTENSPNLRIIYPAATLRPTFQCLCINDIVSLYIIMINLIKSLIKIEFPSRTTTFSSNVFAASCRRRDSPVSAPRAMLEGGCTAAPLSSPCSRRGCSDGTRNRGASVAI